MSALSIWVDESKVQDSTWKTYWIIGQLITRSSEDEFAFLNCLRNAHSKARTWDTLHACEFSSTNDRKWRLLNLWLDEFLNTDNIFFHSFVFEERPEWIAAHWSHHDYFANQVCFWLTNKMKSSWTTTQTLFKDIRTVTIFMDRRSSNSGYIFETEWWVVEVARMNELETVYEWRINATLNRWRGIDREVALRFSFVNSRCFDWIQLCDCLLHMVRDRFMFEKSIEWSNRDFLNLWNDKFLTRHMKSLSDFAYDHKFNYFLSNR